MTTGAIVVTVDGSPASAAALSHAAICARDQGRPLTGIFVLDPGWTGCGCDSTHASGQMQRGFLDYACSELEAQAEAAREQFTAATEDLVDATFEVVPGDPARILCELMARGQAGMLVAGREVFQVCGRPSVKRLMDELQQCVRQPLVIV